MDIQYHGNTNPQTGGSIESYILRENFAVLQNAASLWAHEQSVPNLTVAVSAGSYQIYGNLVTFAGASSSPIVFTGGLPGQQRYAVLTIDESQTLTWYYGTWGILTLPTPPADQVMICAVLSTVGMTTITDSLITDIRPLVGITGIIDLQTAYEGGQTITINSTDGAIVIDNTSSAASIQLNTSTTSNVLEINNSGVGDSIHITQAGNGHALDVIKTNTGAADVIAIDNAGTGWDIKGTTGTWGAT